MAIERLNEGDPTVATQIPGYDPTQGSDRRFSVSKLVALIQSLLTVPSGLITQYFSPTATGWAVTVAPPTQGAGVHLLITPTAGFAAGTITLPAQAECKDGQEVVVTCTQAVTTLTVAGNGSTVNGAPTTLAAQGFFHLRWEGVNRAWYRVG